ncbi:hypothetical protein LZ198_07530 [Myxococcus sp. K15C18031901]|uniref:hypothetical protein n=1 Tax=Myxococcus dinghuensis TaxID=2906761 RepID=UPI0020A7AC68|nr:hypothetical protein [Myxococcus dinghuensis]MCP3098725.1 hypothetical protein [Myxococcus dinghuensis]
MRKLIWNGLVLGGLIVGCAHDKAKQEPVEPDVAAESPSGGDVKPIPSGPPEEEAAKPSEVLPLVVMPNPQPKDAINIEGAKVQGNVLALNVSHGGGCAEHTYTLGWDGQFQKGANGTPVANLVLIHDANGDRCKAMKFAELGFDLSPVSERLTALTGKTGGQAVLSLPGLSIPVQYDF